ncbi:MAG: hypothetical protein AAF446_05080 [Pseudomonadota bacterium]
MKAEAHYFCRTARLADATDHWQDDHPPAVNNGPQHATHRYMGF